MTKLRRVLIEQPVVRLLLEGIGELGLQRRGGCRHRCSSRLYCFAPSGLERIGREEGLAGHRLIGVVHADVPCAGKCIFHQNFVVAFHFGMTWPLPSSSPRPALTSLALSAGESLSIRSTRLVPATLIGSPAARTWAGDVPAVQDRVLLRRSGHRLAIDQELEADEVRRGIDRGCRWAIPRIRNCPRQAAGRRRWWSTSAPLSLVKV